MHHTRHEVASANLLVKDDYATGTIPEDDLEDDSEDDLKDDLKDDLEDDLEDDSELYRVQVAFSEAMLATCT